MSCTLMLILVAILYASGSCFAGEQTDKVRALVEQVSNAAAQVQTLHIKGHYGVSNEPKTGLLVAGPAGRIGFELWRDGERRFVVTLRQGETKAWTIGWNGHELVVVDHQHREWASRPSNDPRNVPLLESAEDRDRLAQWTYMQIAGIWLVDASSYRQMLENAVRKATRAEIVTAADKNGKSFRVLRIEGAQQSGSATMEQAYELYYDSRTLHLKRFVMTATVHAGPLRTRSRRILECEVVQTDLPIDAVRLEVRIPDGYTRAEASRRDAAQRLVGRSTRDWTLELIYPTARRQSFADFAGGMPVVCLVWATWCGPCKIAMRHLEALLDKDGTIGGVRVLTTRRHASCSTTPANTSCGCQWRTTPVSSRPGSTTPAGHRYCSLWTPAAGSSPRRWVTGHSSSRGWLNGFGNCGLGRRLTGSAPQTSRRAPSGSQSTARTRAPDGHCVGRAPRCGR